MVKDTLPEDLTRITGEGSYGDSEDRYAVTFSYTTDEHGLHLTEYTVRSTDVNAPLTRDLRRDIERDLQPTAERWHAEALARYLGTTQLGAGTLTVGTGDDAVSVPLTESNDLRIVERDPALVESIRAQLEHMRRPRRNRRNVEDESFLRDVAEVYLAADRAPTQAVADKFDRTRSQASRYVRHARDIGLLPSSGEETVRD